MVGEGASPVLHTVMLFGNTGRRGEGQAATPNCLSCHAVGSR